MIPIPLQEFSSSLCTQCYGPLHSSPLAAQEPPLLPTEQLPLAKPLSILLANSPPQNLHVSVNQGFWKDRNPFFPDPVLVIYLGLELLYVYVIL